jgi:hypothetical protein
MHTLPINVNIAPITIQYFTPIRLSNGPKETATNNSPRK